MKTRTLKTNLYRTLSILAGALILGTAAFADGPGGGGGGPHRGGGGPGGQHQASLTDISVATLTAELKLTDDQQAKITTIQNSFKEVRRANRPAPPPSQGDDAAAQPDPSAMRASMDKVRAAQNQACDDIEAVLTDSQKATVKPFMKTLNDLQGAGIPAPLYGDLNLTDAQKDKLVAISKATREKMQAARDSEDASRDAMDQIHQDALQQTAAVLTDTQNAQIAKFNKNHQHSRPGGPPPADFGGPPPPSDAG